MTDDIAPGAARQGLRGLVAADRKTLRLGGRDARPFLQDLVTNDVSRLDDGLVYAALLTPQGKYLSDFLLAADGEDVLLDAPAAQADALAKRLTMYRLRRDVSVEEAGLGVALVWGEGWEAVPGARPDPRRPELGGRIYAADPEAALAAVPRATLEERAALRVRLCVPAAGTDLTEDTYILEAGFERLNGVDFRKGCFVGQEIVARMKHKTELRKGILRVSVSGEAAPGDEIVTAEGKVAGRLGSVAGGEGLAHLRFDRADGPLRAGSAEIRRLD